MLNLGQSIAWLMLRASFPAPAQPHFLFLKTTVLITGKMTSIFPPATPFLSTAALQHSACNATASQLTNPTGCSFPSDIPGSYPLCTGKKPNTTTTNTSSTFKGKFTSRNWGPKWPGFCFPCSPPTPDSTESMQPVYSRCCEMWLDPLLFLTYNNP